VTAEEIQQSTLAAGLSPLPEGASEKFADYLNLLLKWNARLNLTAIRKPSEIVARHFLECIQCARAIPGVTTLLDFGSGAGFPGIPISILRPEIDVTLGESQAKKAAFLREAARKLHLNARVFDGRIETMSPTTYFDAVTLRAVDKMEDACSAAVERLVGGGWLVLFGTSTTEQLIKNAAKSITWGVPIPLAGMEDAFLLRGLKDS
jgi:16S rRNA (guanine527-N7)-methyltransferase